jgi:hypothetical protein
LTTQSLSGKWHPALDVPAAWRKSLGGKRDSSQRELFSRLLENDSSSPDDESASTPPDADEFSADETS